MRGWAWGSYVVSLLWVGLLFFHVQRFLTATESETFRREGSRFFEVWAERIADAGSDAPRRGRLLRRLAGTSDSRSVALLDDQGQVIQCVGDSLPALPRLPLSEPRDQWVGPRACVFLAPLWMDGRREGYLVWMRDSSSLERSRARFQRALFAAWAWWAAAGAVLTGLSVNPHRVRVNSAA